MLYKKDLPLQLAAARLNTGEQARFGTVMTNSRLLVLSLKGRHDCGNWMLVLDSIPKVHVTF